MKRFLTALICLLAPTQILASTAQVNNIIGLCNTIGSLSTITTPSATIPFQNLAALGYKVLMVSFAAGPTADHYFSFKDMASMTGAAYHVPSGSKFYAACMSGVTLNATPVSWQLVTGTAAFNADNDNTAPAGVKYSGGSSGAYGLFLGTSSSPYQYNYPIIFDATGGDLYMGLQVGANGSFGGVILVGKVQ